MNIKSILITFAVLALYTFASHANDAVRRIEHDSVFGKWHEADPLPVPVTPPSPPDGVVQIGINRTGLFGVEVDILALRHAIQDYERPTKTVYYERMVPVWDGGQYADASGGVLDAGIHVERGEIEVPLTRWERAKKVARERPVMTTVGLVATGFAIHWAGDKYVWGGGSGGGTEERDRPNAETNAGENSNNITVIGDGNTVTVTTNDGSFNPSGAGD